MSDDATDAGRAGDDKAAQPPIQFFGNERGAQGEDSVFRAVDQSDLMARLGDGAIEDDYADPFFDHSLLSTQVPTRSVDVGIRTVVQGAAVVTASSVEPAGDRLGVTVAPALASDPVARRRFILEGPASLSPPLP